MEPYCSFPFVTTAWTFPDVGHSSLHPGSLTSILT